MTKNIVGETLSIGPELRDEQWLMTGGSHFEVLRRPGVENVTLDLTALGWADPVPLLSLACVLSEFTARGGNLTVRLGAPRDAKATRFLIFLGRHGFLRVLAKEAKLSWEGRTYQGDQLGEIETKLRNLKGILAYRDAECILARVFAPDELKHPDLDRIIEDLVSSAHSKITSWLGGNARRRGLMLHRIRVILLEALDNVAEHAYDAYDGSGFGAIYARIRSGAPDESSALSEWEGNRWAENRACPALNRCNTGKRPGWLELFVCDAGRGLTHGLSSDGVEPLMKIANKLFKEGVSRHSSRPLANKTTITGLQLLGNLLTASVPSGGRGDFVRIYSSGEWVGEHLPWPPDGLMAGRRNVRKNNTAKYPPGCTLHLSIEPPPAGAQEQLKFYPSSFCIPSKAQLAQVREVLLDEKNPLFAAQYDFVDLYVGRIEDTRGRGERGLTWTKGIIRPLVMVRPSKAQRKIDLIQQISVLQNHSGATVSTVAFVDVPWSAAIDFANVISNERSNVQEARRPFDVLVVSQDWACAAFSFNPAAKAFRPNEEFARKFFESGPEEISAALVASALRVRDSKLFWGNVGDAYLNEPVTWITESQMSPGLETTIWGYLDVALALSKPPVFDSAKRALRRALSAFGEPVVYVADELVRSLVYGEFDLEDAVSPNKASSVDVGVLAGSVVGTGSTAQRFLLGRGSKAGNAYLFQHPDLCNHLVERSTALALDWDPPRPSGKRPRNVYKRICNTPFIIRGGESAIPLPRFSETNDGKLGQSLYGEAPNEAYQRWQKLGLLRLGHWTYGLHHDILTLRLPDALEYDAAEGGPIIRWFVKQIKEWLHLGANNHEGCIIVYPQHVVTDRLIRAILRDSSLTQLKTFPLPILKEWSRSPIVISPMTREKIGRVFLDDFRSGGRVIFIDDGIVSGTTFSQVGGALDALWETIKQSGGFDTSAQMTLCSLAMVDRSGLPAQRSLVARDLSRHRRFWRWDVPTLGHEGSCTLCTLRGRWLKMLEMVQSEALKGRIQQWLESWAPVRVEDGRFDVGIQPRMLPPNDRTRFSIERTAKGGEVSHHVEHLISTSRASIAVEIARSTTRKDYPLRKARGEIGEAGVSLDIETRIEILICHMLLCWQELSRVDRLERLKLLLQLLWQTTEPNVTTAVACMSLEMYPESLIELWTECVNLIDTQGFPHDDTLIAAIAVHRGSQAEAPPIGSHPDWVLFDLCRESSNSYREPVARVFRVFGWNPDTVHRNMLPDLLRKREHTPRTLSQSFLMIEGLAQAMESLKPAITEASDLDAKNDATTLRNMIENLKLGNEPAIDPYNSRPPDLAYFFRLHAVLRVNSSLERRVQETLDNAYTYLFGPSGAQLRYISSLTASLEAETPAEFLLKHQLDAIAEDWPRLIREKGKVVEGRWLQAPSIMFAPSKLPQKRLRLYFDSLVRKAIIELLSNVMHREGQIACPWPGREDFPPADMWGRLSASEDGSSATIELVNGSTSEGAIHLHTTASLYHLQALGGRVMVEQDGSRQTVAVKLEIPTIAGLVRG